MTKVLLIEDDAWLAELQMGVLAGEGYEVSHVKNALDAMARIEAGQLPDVMVLDVLLTGSTAFALLHELRSYPDTEAIPIILCTTIAEHFSSSALKEYGVRRIVDKTTMHPRDVVVAIKAVTA